MSAGVISAYIQYMWRRPQLDSLKSGYTIGTQIVKVYIEVMKQAWEVVGYTNVVLFYTIRGIRWKPHRKKEKWRAVRVQYHYNAWPYKSVTCNAYCTKLLEVWLCHFWVNMTQLLSTYWKVWLIVTENNVFSLSQQTPMHTAAKEGNEYTMEGLVKLGADINIKDKDGVSETQNITAGRFD